MVKYFLSYSYEGGFGNGFVNTTGRIKSIDDIRAIQKRIEAAYPGVDGVIILYFKEVEV